MLAVSQGEGQSVVFDWRKFNQLVPFETDPQEVTNLDDDPSKYPILRGQRYEFPGTNQAFIRLTAATAKQIKMQWFYPFSPEFWTPSEYLQEIYSTSRIDLSPGSPTVGILTLRYAGKIIFHNQLIFL